jgi:hypothetical protein
MSASRWNFTWAYFPLLLASTLPVACSAGSDGASSHPGGTYYVKTCARTNCDLCQETVSSSCRRCTTVCSQPGAYSGCFNDCSDICTSPCDSCSGPSSCREWKVEVPIPPLDPPLYDACLRVAGACWEGDYDYSYCNLFARTMQPDTVRWLECLFNLSCDAMTCDTVLPSIGTLGTTFCERSRDCGRACSDGSVLLLNDFENTLRPELKRSVEECIAEPSCGDFEACARAHDDVWALAWEHGAPGSGSSP